MKTAIIICIVIIVGLLLFIRSERKRGKNVYGKATAYEKSKDYEAACFHYAVAMNAGHDKTLCQENIKELWQKYGPFDFHKQLEEIKADYCEDKSCGEGFHVLTVSDIQKIVNAKGKKETI